MNKKLKYYHFSCDIPGVGWNEVVSAYSKREAISKVNKIRKNYYKFTHIELLPDNCIQLSSKYEEVRKEHQREVDDLTDCYNVLKQAIDNKYRNKHAELLGDILYETGINRMSKELTREIDKDILERLVSVAKNTNLNGVLPTVSNVIYEKNKI